MNKEYIFQNINILKFNKQNVLIKDVYENVFNNLSNLNNFLYACIYKLNPEFFIFEMDNISNPDLTKIADENFEILLENGIISRTIEKGKYELFPEFRDKENSLNFVILPIITSENINYLFVLALEEYWFVDKEINIKFCEIQVELLSYYLDLLSQKEKNKLLSQELNDLKHTNINDVLLHNEVVDTILNSIQSGVVIAKKDTKEIIKVNAVANKIISDQTYSLASSYIDEFLPLHNNISNVHFESKLKNIKGQTVDILRRNTIALIDGIEYMVESFIEISEQKKIQSILKDHNNDLEKLVNEKTNDLYKTIEKLENSINQTKQLEETAENEKKYSELKSKFLLMVGHEFRTPLTVIRNNVEIIKNYKEKLTAIQLDQYANRIISSIDYIATILLNINKYQEDVSALKIQSDLQIFVHEVFEAKINELKKSTNKPVFINIDVPEELLLEYHIDTFSPILFNLLDNIFVYSNEMVLAEIVYKKQGQYHVYEFNDKGIGIPKEDLNRICDIFYRGSNVVNRPGVGMGLAVVKKILQFVNGFIYIESIENVETKITVKLPIISNF